MMPELGKYAGVVLSSWGLSIGLIAALLALTLWRGRKIKRALAEAEARAAEARR